MLQAVVESKQRIQQRVRDIADVYTCTCQCDFSSICRRYDDISSKVYEEPHTTEEIVQLSQFLLKSRDETVYKLKLEVGQAAERVLFLFNYVEFTGMNIVEYHLMLVVCVISCRG
jgi:hypothetical protein